MPGPHRVGHEHKPCTELTNLARPCPWNCIHQVQIYYMLLLLDRHYSSNGSDSHNKTLELGSSGKTQGCLY